MTPEEKQIIEDYFHECEYIIGQDEIGLLLDKINNLLKSRQEKMIEVIKEMSLCYADDSIENEMDYITGQAHFKKHIIDMFNQGLDKGIEIIKNI